MPLLRRQSPSEPEEVNVANGVVAMRRSGMAGRIRRGGRQNAYATLFQFPFTLSIILRSTSMNHFHRLMIFSSPNNPSLELSTPLLPVFSASQAGRPGTFA